MPGSFLKPYDYEGRSVGAALAVPGKANWQQLFELEYRQLFEEGYPVGDRFEPDWPSVYLPVPDQNKQKADIAESSWEIAYQNLWKIRKGGLRSDFPFIEPNEYQGIIDDAASPPILKPLDPIDYAERIKGAWFGRCAGVVLGKPFEMGLNRLEIQEYLESLDAYPLDDWAPLRSEKLGKELRKDCLPSSRGQVRFVQPDDDTHYTILALLLAEEKGLNFSKLDIGENLLDHIPYEWLWSATGQAYYHLMNLSGERPTDEQLDQLPLEINPWREGINGAIRADFWGYISPGNPRRAARLAHQIASFNMVKNGIYGAMFVAGCISAALTRHPTVETILQGGMCVIPKKSRLAAVVEDVVTWYAKEKGWISVCDRIYEKYGHLGFSACLNNMAFTVLALIHGNLDYSRTITTAVMCGTDTDCTGGTAGSIVGAALGNRKLEAKWIEPLNDCIKTHVGGVGEGSITELAQRTVNFAQSHIWTTHSGFGDNFFVLRSGTKKLSPLNPAIFRRSR
jgi:ADP-ribosylglycohydrolase